MSDFTAGRTSPCKGCPWVVGQSSRSHVEQDRHDAASSAFDGSQGFHTIMACHTNPADEEGACIGYLLSDHAWDNFAVRMAANQGWFDPRSLECDDELYPTYDQMYAGMLAEGQT